MTSSDTGTSTRRDVDKTHDVVDRTESEGTGRDGGEVNDRMPTDDARGVYWLVLSLSSEES